MSRLAKVLSLLILTVATGSAVPVVNEGGIVNGASFAFSALPQWGIAQGSLFNVFGTGMGPAEIEMVTAFPIPTELGGTSVQVTVGETTVHCLMIFTTDRQVAAVLPSNTPLGEGTLTVTFNGETSEPERIIVVETAVGIFTLAQNGLGPAIVTDASFVGNTVVNAFAPGDTGVLWLTGLGARTEDQPPAAMDFKDSLDLTVMVGTGAANVTYAGPTGCCVGLDQINFEIPPGQEGCAVSMAVEVDGRVSNYTSMSISSNGQVCDDDPLALATADIETLQDQGSLAVGLVIYDTIFANTIIVGGMAAQDSPGMHDQRFDVAQVLPFEVTSLNPANPVLAVAPGSCLVQNLPLGQMAPPPSTPFPPDQFAIIADTTGPGINAQPLDPSNLLLVDPNPPEATGGLTFRPGESWMMDITVTDVMTEQTIPSTVSRTLALDPEPQGNWDPGPTGDGLRSLFSGSPPSGDFTIDSLPSTGSQFVAGFLTISNSTYTTTISCTVPGDQTFHFPAHTLQSVDCNGLGPCTGSLDLLIVPGSPAVNVSSEFFDKLNGFDRVRTIFSVMQPPQ